MKKDHSIQLLCQVLDVSPSGYYDWQKRHQTPSARARQNQSLSQQIKTIHAKSRQTYGSPRVTDQLRKDGH